ncbi:MAG: hypothetical protein FWF43_02640 [Propionibacteriaceae bacterium]|nr:hypothetical protein [Propionibacteriaceae bacterium]
MGPDHPRKPGPVTRRPSKHLQAPRPLSSAHAKAELKADGRWIVQSMPGARASKSYRCPGCQAMIPPGTAHIVAWPDTPSLGSQRAVDDRRHWHTACWEHRA